MSADPFRDIVKQYAHLYRESEEARIASFEKKVKRLSGVEKQNEIYLKALEAPQNIMKIKVYNDPTVRNWVSSDLHLGHKQPFIWQKRGYNSVTEHDDAVINKINELIAPEDNFWYLGDFCLNTDETQFESYLSRINCQNIHLIWGNHPNPLKKIYYRETSKTYSAGVDVYPFRYKKINFIGYQYECVIHGKYVVMNHFPLTIWENMKEGSYMLCGHSHYSYPGSRAEAQEGLILDCGWDGHARPLLFTEIVDIMNKKSIRQVDHHVKERPDFF